MLILYMMTLLAMFVRNEVLNMSYAPRGTQKTLILQSHYHTYHSISAILNDVGCTSVKNV